MDTNKDTTWIVVADASRARVFAWGRGKHPLVLIETFVHPASRMLNQDLVTDRPGRSQEAAPAAANRGPGPSRGSRAGMEPHTSPKTVEHEQFAHQISGALRKGLMDHAYQHLVLVAEPRFLGQLREALDEQVSRHVVATVDKDYAQLDERDLLDRLAPHLPGAQSPA